MRKKWSGMLRRWVAHRARTVLDNGGVIAYPTEAVYGLGVSPDNPYAIKKLLDLKQRKRDKGLIVVASSLDQVLCYIADQLAVDWSAILDSWPGPVTWVFPAGKSASDWLTGKHHSIAIRISDHPVVCALCRAVGPLVSTSANPGSRQPAKSVLRVRSYFGGEIDLIVPGRLGSCGTPTEIRDALSGRILRAGGDRGE